MHPAIRKCLSNLGFSDAAPPPTAPSAGKSGARALDAAALFGTSGGGRASPAPSPAERSVVYKYQPVWKSVADLRFAAINRVLDCLDGNPAYAAKAIAQYAALAS